MNSGKKRMASASRKRPDLSPDDGEDDVEEEVEDEDEEEEQEEQETIEVDFDFYNQQEKDFHSIKSLVRHMLPPRCRLDSSSLSDSIVGAQVGSVVKSDGAGDSEEALAVVSALPISGDASWVAQVCEAVGPEGRKTISERRNVGLVVCERIINMPTVKLAPSMHKSLFDEIGEAQMEPPFDCYLLFVRKYRCVPSEIDDDDDEDEDEQPESKRRREQEAEEFLQPEEEEYVKQATKVVEVPNEGGARQVREEKEEDDDDRAKESAGVSMESGMEIRNSYLAVFFSPDRVPSILSSIRRLWGAD